MNAEDLTPERPEVAKARDGRSTVPDPEEIKQALEEAQQAVKDMVDQALGRK